MEKMLWQDSYATGIRVIDADHKMLFSIVNNLIVEVTADTDPDPRLIESLFEALVKYVDTHFEREEQFLEQYEYPQLDTHRQSHDGLRQQIYEIFNDYRADPNLVDLEKVTDFVADWLKGHILKSDMDYVPYMKGEVETTDLSPPMPTQKITVSVPLGTGNLIYELAHHLRQSPTIDAAIEEFNEAQIRANQNRGAFQKG